MESKFKISPEETFEKGKKLFTRCNTAYPLNKDIWKKYKSDSDMTYFNKEEKVGLYIHIPFCNNLCQFCQYVRIKTPGEDFINKYISALRKELSMYRDNIDFRDKKLTGFDLGGGTPTVLSEDNLERIMQLADNFMEPMKKINNFTTSVETTIGIASENYSKIRTLADLGFNRLSLGLQSVSKKLLTEMGRPHNEYSSYEKAFKHAKNSGFKIINIDIMYGLPGQTMKQWKESLEVIISLKPEHISIYEVRYNDIEIQHRESEIKWQTILNMYNYAHEQLSASGYIGDYGTSAYTLNPDDRGLSSYLQARTEDFTAYIGFGAGSQSMSSQHLSYNYGRSDHDIARYISQVEHGNPFEYFYKLPTEEALAKYISITFYYGDFDITKLNSRLDIDIEKHFKDELSFLKSKGFIKKADKKFILTPLGYRNYHGIVPLFYSHREKLNLLKQQ